MNLAEWFETTGLAQGPHTVLAELLQLDTLYWPIAHTEQGVHVVDTTAPEAVEYVPVPQRVHLVLSGRPLPVA